MSTDQHRATTALGANVLAPVSGGRAAEATETLAAGPGVRIERIVSMGHASPDGFWYDQAEAEWVMIVSGRARLQIAGQDGAIDMGLGDTLLIPAHCRHRVAWTDPKQPTVWLAVFVAGDLIGDKGFVAGRVKGETG